MLDEQLFAEGMAKMAVAYDREPTSNRTEVYYQIIGPALTAAQWDRAVRQTLETWTPKSSTDFPPIATLLEHGRASDVNPILPAQGARIYAAVLDAYERGIRMDQRAIGEQYGSAARDAFMVAGGPRAFEWCEPRNEPFRRKAFIEAFVETVKVLGVDTTVMGMLEGAVTLIEWPINEPKLLGGGR